MPQGFWEARQTAKEGGIAGVAGSVNWGEKFRSIPQRLSEFAWKARSWQFRPAKPTYSGEIIFRQQFGGSTAYYSVETPQEQEPAIEVRYKQGHSWVTWFSGGIPGESDTNDVLREIRIIYWLRNDENIGRDKLKRWMDYACQQLFRDGTPLHDVENWHKAKSDYEVFEAITGSGVVEISDYEYRFVRGEYWDRHLNHKIGETVFEKF